MANIVRVRVELKKKYNDPDKNYREMLQEFKRRLSHAGVLHQYKEHQTYESKSEKRRKRKRDAQKKLLIQSIEKRLLAGEQVRTPAGLVKKIMANLKKDKNDKKKDRKHKQHYDE